MLIGLPGAGKTTVAPLVADLLQCAWCDIDQRIVAQSGLTITDIFAQLGERHFRELERDAMAAALAEAPQVISTGGGWAAEPGNLDAAAGRALLIYLSLAPAVASARLLGSGDRPILARGEPEQRMTDLLAARERWYRLADIEIAAGDASPNTLAASIAVAARQYGG